VNGKTEVVPLLVSGGPTLTRDLDHAEFLVHRVQRGFRVTTVLNGVSASESVVDLSEADEYVFSKASELKNDGFEEIP